MTSEGLGEMSEGNSADMCAGKFPLTSMGAEQRVSSAQTRERGPPSTRAEFFLVPIPIVLQIIVKVFSDVLEVRENIKHNMV